MAQIFSVDDLSGGLSLVDPLNIKDNQFEVCKNMFYNKDKRLQSRRGYTKYGKPLPDSVELINACDAVTDWAVANDATNLTLDTTNEIRGTGALNFDMAAYSAGQGTLTLTAGSTVDISAEKGYVGFWVNFPTGYTTDLTSIQLRIGSDSSNYYSWTLTNPPEGENTFIVLQFADATTTGLPDDAAIDYTQFIITTAAGYTGYTDFIIDDIRCYSANSTKPVTSIFHWQNDTTLVNYLLAVAGSNMFAYDETTDYWNLIDSGLTEFETATGRTTERTRWDFAVYKNEVYMVNGIDDYRKWDGVAITNLAGPQGRYIRYMEDRMYLAGDDANPSTLSYTGALPTNANTFGNTLVIGAEEQGRINGIQELGSVIMVFKDSKIYSFNVSGPSATAIDTQNGGYAHRAIENVENGMLYFSDRGIDNVQPRGGVTGGSSLASESRTADISQKMRNIALKQYNASTGHYIKELTNYYFTYDDENDNKPNETIVMSTLIGESWTEYTLPGMYDYTKYIDSNRVPRHLISSSNGGQLYQIESGFDDDGLEIECEIKTKKHDFGDFSGKKSFQFVDVVGLKAEGNDITVNVLGEDDLSLGSGTITDNYQTSETPLATISVLPISIEDLGGGSPSQAEIDLFPYRIRIPVSAANTSTVQVQMTSSAKAFAWTVDHMKMLYEPLDIEIFDIDKIA